VDRGTVLLVDISFKFLTYGPTIQLDDQYPVYHAIKKHRIQSRGKDLIRVLPDRPGLVKSGIHSGTSL
jgi:hypothetical protein